MAQLSYKGAALSSSQDVAYRPYAATLKNSDLSTSTVGTLIDAKLASYPSEAVIRGLDNLLVTTSFIDTQDSYRLIKELRAAPSGVAPLDNTGKIPVTHFPVASSQSWNGTPAIPITYNLDPVLLENGDPTTALYVCDIPDPGYPYRLLVFGQCDTSSTSDFHYPIVNVRVGSVSGTVIAKGAAAADGVVTHYMGDDFNRANNNTLGETWNVTYDGEGTGSEIAIFNNEALLKVANSPLNKTRSVACQRIDPATKVTGTNYQRITFNVGSRSGSKLVDTAKQGYPYFRLYMRANDAFTQWCAFEVGNNEARFVYNTGSGERFFSQVTEITKKLEWEANTTWWAHAGGDWNSVSERLFTLYKMTYDGPIKVLEIDDSSFYTVLGPNNRGWGFGLQNTLFLIGQTMSPSIDSIYINDMAWPYEPAAILPYNASGTTFNGLTTLYVQVTSGSLSAPSGYAFPVSDALAFSSYRPHLMAMVVPVT